MDKIPTAEEFLRTTYKGKYKDYYKFETFVSNIEYDMIAFAKLHVDAALKAAYDNHKLEYIHEDPRRGSAKELVKGSILNAYPLNNIK